MNKLQRQKRLVDIMQSKGILPIKTLASMIDVSEMTIRRDLRELQTQGNDFTVGISSSHASSEYDLMQALERANSQKERIGHFAASLIEPNDVICIDTGSTTAKMLPHLATNQNITVLCYNANVLMSLLNQKGIQLLFGGGVYHKNTEMFESPEMIQFIRRTRINKSFLSAAGVEKALGVTCVNSYEVATKRAVIDSSQQRILLVDSGKFDQVRPSYFCELDDIQVIVSDTNLSQDWQQYIRSKGITLYLA